MPLRVRSSESPPRRSAATEREQEQRPYQGGGDNSSLSANAITDDPDDNLTDNGADQQSVADSCRDGRRVYCRVQYVEDAVMST